MGEIHKNPRFRVHTEVDFPCRASLHGSSLGKDPSRFDSCASWDFLSSKIVNLPYLVYRIKTFPLYTYGHIQVIHNCFVWYASTMFDPFFMQQIVSFIPLGDFESFILEANIWHMCNCAHFVMTFGCFRPPSPDLCHTIIPTLD